jgi:hypothetical protein
LALLGLALVIPVYAAACAAIGLCASVVARSSMQASMAAFFIVAGLSIAQGALYATTQALDNSRFGPHEIEFHALSFTPPATIVMLAFSTHEWSAMRSEEQRWMRKTILKTLITWSIIAVPFYWLARLSFHARRIRHQFSPLRIRQKLTTS